MAKVWSTCKVSRCCDDNSGCFSLYRIFVIFYTFTFLKHLYKPFLIPCGTRDEQWCFNGFCVWKSHTDLAPKPVDGTWGDWSSWDGCSRTCGVGIQYRARTCQMPQHGGVNRCQGDNYEFQVCNTHECVDTHGRKTVDDFRDYQCQQLNNRALYQSQIVEWNAGYLDDHSACQLVCSTKIQCRGFGKKKWKQ